MAISDCIAKHARGHITKAFSVWDEATFHETDTRKDPHEDVGVVECGLYTPDDAQNNSQLLAWQVGISNNL